VDGERDRDRSCDLDSSGSGSSRPTAPNNNQSRVQIVKDPGLEIARCHGHSWARLNLRQIQIRKSLLSRWVGRPDEETDVSDDERDNECKDGLDGV